ncbi:MAG: class I SAM-dependent methyltransferase, partial [Trebonia sp.]
MLYHVPSPADAVRELRRVTRPGGRVVVGLNGAGHMREFRAAITAAGGRQLPDERHSGRERVGLDDGAELLRTVFGSVTRHDFEGQLLAPPAAVAAYVRSTPRADDLEALVTCVLSLLFPNDSAPSPITTHSGILVCA